LKNWFKPVSKNYFLMLPELILKEERSDSFPLLFVLGFFCSLTGFVAANSLFPSESSVLTVAFASFPMVYPLTTKFFGDEKEEGESYFEEYSIYSFLFLGQALGFTLISLLWPEAFSLQAEVAGVSGNAVAGGLFLQIFSNNLIIFSGILALSAVIGSAGAFILVWNASVLGRFFASLMRDLTSLELFTGSSEAASPLAYVPHASLEMSGFILAGVSGSMISAAVYRRHFDKATWVSVAKLTGIGLLCLLAGALLEAA
jgi:uncharacterized membrane protein SpoIIM required for sporulation